jgi:hypothetical protein
VFLLNGYGVERKVIMVKNQTIKKSSKQGRKKNKPTMRLEKSDTGYVAPQWKVSKTSHGCKLRLAVNDPELKGVHSIVFEGPCAKGVLAHGDLYSDVWSLLTCPKWEYETYLDKFQVLVIRGHKYDEEHASFDSVVMKLHLQDDFYQQHFVILARNCGVTLDYTVGGTSISCPKRRDRKRTMLMNIHDDTHSAFVPVSTRFRHTFATLIGSS